jgi:transcriptional antiterminator NusG
MAELAEQTQAAEALAALIRGDAEPEEAGATEAEEAAEEAVEEAEAPAEPTAGADVDTAADVEAQAEAEDEDEEAAATVAPMAPASPYDLPGSWYVVHSYSGYENKVKMNLETRVKSMHLEDKIFDVVIPMEEVVEFKAGKKVNVNRKKFPGYILVRLYMDDDAWYAVRNTPGVTGFVGSAHKPTPLSRREVERILGVRRDEEEKKEPRFKPAWEVGETVRVVEGPFADFNGVIEDINVDQSKVRVLVDIFGRETPVELNFDQIVKY